mmetsp:Transcript_46502/g.68738  ORF Transcript_46502/g.68738 Transcript_46502/m.68738 type:complete len:265 (+) Transcript_46502:90-884(+)|eukprot:CAMPEP_0195522542 /NCGR_PEP_ID=MMETSP0794_2-20130614/20810_1 /TAXON_ID=515487 /ORGANISM="Stephanopyxis turris, Strain CCMP 815" /LENGTH=264 /DNA_ID=CAMNT_0040652317 /DNA_START=72 /DNA_END=866 /DNA_ORIENTATION=+
MRLVLFFAGTFLSECFVSAAIFECGFVPCTNHCEKTRSAVRVFASDDNRLNQATWVRRKKSNSQIQDAESSRILDDFKFEGEVIHPYKLLKVSRTAGNVEIKRAYYKMCKKYHPDGVRFRKILPGKCNDLEDVEHEFQRIKFAYEILMNRTRRIRYDRNSAIMDPGAAMRRAALDAVGWGISGVSKGIWKIGEITLNQSKEEHHQPSKGLVEKPRNEIINVLEVMTGKESTTNERYVNQLESDREVLLNMEITTNQLPKDQTRP